MQKNLNTTERQRLNKHFGAEGKEHPLLLACSVVFKVRAGLLDGKVEVEDVFRLVAWTLDMLFSCSEDDAHMQQDIDDLWYEQMQNLRNWPESTVKDRLIIVDTVFRIVRKLLCHYWDTYYSEWLYNMFTDTLRREGIKDESEVAKIQERLSELSELLDEWVNNGYDCHLYEETEAVLKGQTAQIKQLKPHSGRKSINPNDITASFNYLPLIEYRNERLQAFFNCLKGRFIDKSTDMRTFVDMFQNKTTTSRIVWIRDIKELQYLLNKLVKNQWICWPKKYGKWQMACARFQIRKKDKKCIDDSMTNDSFIIEDMRLSQFNKGGKLPNQHKELDRIISILNPKTDYGTALEDYLSYKEVQGEHSEIEDAADALSNGLNTDLHF